MGRRGSAAHRVKNKKARSDVLRALKFGRSTEAPLR